MIKGSHTSYTHQSYRSEDKYCEEDIAVNNCYNEKNRCKQMRKIFSGTVRIPTHSIIQLKI